MHVCQPRARAAVGVCAKGLHTRKLPGLGAGVDVCRLCPTQGLRTCKLPGLGDVCSGRRGRWLRVVAANDERAQHHQVVAQLLIHGAEALEREASAQASKVCYSPFDS